VAAWLRPMAASIASAGCLASFPTAHHLSLPLREAVSLRINDPGCTCIAGVRNKAATAAAMLVIRAVGMYSGDQPIGDGYCPRYNFDFYNNGSVSEAKLEQTGRNAMDTSAHVDGTEDNWKTAVRWLALRCPNQLAVLDVMKLLCRRAGQAETR
jgi:hypothetical protein